MPPANQKKFKKSKQRDRRVAGFDEIKNRNSKQSDDEGDAKPSKENDEDSSSSEEEEEVKKDPKVYVKPRSTGVDFERQVMNKGMGGNDEEMFGGGMTRKQREEMQKEAAKKKYEKLHKEGKTDEAQKDLARLAEIRKKREEAKAEREEEAKAKEAATAARNSKKGGGAAKEFYAALGGDAAKPGGRKVDRTNDQCKDMYSDYRTGQEAEVVDPENVKVGSIEACRLEEEDFM